MTTHVWTIASATTTPCPIGGRNTTDGVDYAHELWQEAVIERRPNVLVGGEKVPA